MTDVAMALDALVPAAEYRGSLTENSYEAFQALEWLDSREKPSWEAVQSAGFHQVVPTSVTMRQARQAMLNAGILGQVDSLIAAMPGEEGESARIDWNHAREVKRDWPLIGALGPQLGLTEQQIDDLFIYAATVPQ